MLAALDDRRANVILGGAFMSGRGTTKVGPRLFLCAFLILFSSFLVFAECHLSVVWLVRVDKVVVERFAPPGSPDA